MGRPHSDRLDVIAERMEGCAATGLVPDSHEQADDLLLETIETLYSEERVPRAQVDRIITAYRDVLRWFA